MAWSLTSLSNLVTLPVKVGCLKGSSLLLCKHGAGDRRIEIDVIGAFLASGSCSNAAIVA